MTYLQNLQSNTQIFLNDKKDVFLHYPKYDQKFHILFRVISGTNPSVGHSEGSLVFILYLLIATVITYGLIKHMTPGFFFTMLMIFCFTLFVIDWITLFNPFSFCHRYFVFLTFLTLNLFCFDNRWNWYRFTNLKKTQLLLPQNFNDCKYKYSKNCFVGKCIYYDFSEILDFFKQLCNNIHDGTITHISTGRLVQYGSSPSTILPPHAGRK